jgi:hypothetical protein
MDVLPAGAVCSGIGIGIAVAPLWCVADDDLGGALAAGFVRAFSPAAFFAVGFEGIGMVMPGMLIGIGCAAAASAANTNPVPSRIGKDFMRAAARLHSRLPPGAP